MDSIISQWENACDFQSIRQQKKAKQTQHDENKIRKEKEFTEDRDGEIYYIIYNLK